MKTYDMRKFLEDDPMFWEGFASCQLDIAAWGGLRNLTDRTPQERKSWMKGWVQADIMMGGIGDE